MGGLAEQLVADSVAALVRARQRALPSASSPSDPRIDLLQRPIEDSAIQMIARRQPMAQDLREIMAAIHIATDLERVGDLAKNTAKRVHRGRRQFRRRAACRRRRAHRRDEPRARSRTCSTPIADRDLAAAREVWERDDEIDAMYTSLFRELLTYMMEDPRKITFCTHLLFCAKNLERIGDHATNIAETLHYLITGVAAHRRAAEGDNSSLTSVEYQMSGPEASRSR